MRTRETQRLDYAFLASQTRRPRPPKPRSPKRRSPTPPGDSELTESPSPEHLGFLDGEIAPNDRLGALAKAAAAQAGIDVEREHGKEDSGPSEEEISGKELDLDGHIRRDFLSDEDYIGEGPPPSAQAEINSPSSTSPLIYRSKIIRPI